MANWSDPQVGVTPQGGTVGTATGVSVDAGLRAHMLSVYNYMTSGILLTGIVSLLFAWGGRESLAFQIFATGGILRWVVMLAPLGIVLWMSFGINRISQGTAQILFWVFSALMGASISRSGMPHRPNPPAQIVIPSNSRPSSAAAASG